MASLLFFTRAGDELHSFRLPIHTAHDGRAYPTPHLPCQVCYGLLDVGICEHMTFLKRGSCPAAPAPPSTARTRHSAARLRATPHGEHAHAAAHTPHTSPAVWCVQDAGITAPRCFARGRATPATASPQAPAPSHRTPALKPHPARRHPPTCTPTLQCCLSSCIYHHAFQDYPPHQDSLPHTHTTFSFYRLPHPFGAFVLGTYCTT